MKNMLMNANMTKAILDGRKTQTRKIGITSHGKYIIDDNLLKSYKLSNQDILKCGKYQKDEVIWVREPAEIIEFSPSENIGGSLVESSARVKYLADGYETYWNEFPDNPKSWLSKCKRVPVGCTKTMARIFLKITNVKIERLHSISIDDICKDAGLIKNDYKRLFAYPNHIERKWIDLWNKTAPKYYKWDDNPYVFVYEFEKTDIKDK